ncbi:MAG TPA: MFS transporter [Ktedonobacterales bacterium]|nr:MFS transporter [Ktedonobacterales bacterium]
MFHVKGSRADAETADVADPSGNARAAQKQGTFAALRYRNYRLYWFGQLISVTGTFMQGTAQAWLVLLLSKNPLSLGIVGALQFGPMLVPFGGAIADRFPRRTILVYTQISAGILALILFLLTVTHTVQLWHVFALAFALGLVNAVDNPTRQAFVSEMVPRESLLNAVSLNSAQFNASRIVGPGLAGELIFLLGVPLLFLLNAVSYIAVIVGLLMMRKRDLVPMPHSAVTHGMARIRAMGDGARFVWRTPKLRTTFIMIAVIGIFGFNFNVMLPLEAKTSLHAGSQVYGWLSSALGTGALIGALLLAKRGGEPTNRLLVWTGATFGLLEAGIALTNSLPLVLLLVAFTGFVMSMFSASANTRVQMNSPLELRGRVMSVYVMVFIGTTPIGSLFISSVAGQSGVSAAFVAAGLPCFLVALVAAWIWKRERNGSSGGTVTPVTPVVTAPQPGLPLSQPAAAFTVTERPSRPPRLAPCQPTPQPRAATRE